MKDVFKTFDQSTSPTGGATTGVNQVAATNSGQPFSQPGLVTTSNASSLYGLMIALWGMEMETGGTFNWKTVSETQEFLIELLNTNRHRIPEWGKIPGIDAKSTKSAEVMNKFLAEKGFNIVMDDLGPDAFYVAALTEFIMKWIARGEMTTFTINDSEEVYLASAFKARTSFVDLGDGEHALVRDLDGVGDQNFSVVVTNSPYGSKALTPVELVELVQKNAQLVREASYSKDIGIAYVPYVAAHVQTDLDFLVGLSCGDGTIEQAKFEMKAVIDRNGYASKTATVAGGTRGLSPQGTLFFPNPVITLVNTTDFRNPEAVEVLHVGTDSWVQYGVNDEVFRDDESYDMLTSTHTKNFLTS